MREISTETIWIIFVVTIVLLTLAAAFILTIITSHRRRLTMQLQQIEEVRGKQERIEEQAALLEKASDAIIVRNLENKILYWNKSAERLLGWSKEEAVGKSELDLVHYKEQLPQFYHAMGEVLSGGEWSGELRLSSKTKEEILVTSRWTLVRDQNGDPKSILVVNTDITEKRRLESQFLRSQRMESIGVLAGGIAHDLNNVLNPIVMSIDLLNGMTTGSESKRVLKAIETSAKRGASMVRQLLMFARGVDGSRLLVQPKYLMKEIFTLTKETFPKSIEIAMELEPDLWTIAGDSTQLHQVILNLCVNARDAMPNGGRLTLAAENATIDETFARVNQETKPGPYVVFKVVDTGVGIAPGHLQRIFEPFYTTKDPGKGTGLGLSTAYGIVKNHGGFIHANSVPGKGATFLFYLPAVSSIEMIEDEEQPLEEFRGSGEVILVVDDESSVREITRLALENRGYKVLTAADGVDGLTAYSRSQGQVHVVIIDMMMPHMDGVALINAIRKLNQGTTIIATSGYATSEQEKESRKAGANAFLKKPYTTYELVRTLHRVVSPDGVNRRLNSN